MCLAKRMAAYNHYDVGIGARSLLICRCYVLHMPNHIAYRTLANGVNLSLEKYIEIVTLIHTTVLQLR